MGRAGAARACAAALLVLLAGGCRRGPALQVVGESVKRRRGQPAPARSPLFDGTRVRLRGARGETLGVQVLLRPGGRKVALALEGPARVEAFEVRSLTVREPSTDMYGPSRGAGAYPDVLLPAPAGVVAAADEAFFDVAIAPGAPPGRYGGQLTLDEDRFPVELVVEPVTIDPGADPLVWVFYLPREIARVHGTPDDDGAAELAWEARYHALFRAHGTYLASDLPPARFAARADFVRGVRYWPVAVDLATDERLGADVRAWLGLFGGRAQVPFAIPIDEPRTPAARARVRHIGDVMGAAGGRPPRFLRAVTDEPQPLYGDALDVYFSAAAIAAPPRDRGAGAGLGPRFWMVNGAPPRAGSMILDTDGTALRSWGWIAFRYGVELWYAWEGLYFSDRYNEAGPTDVMTEPLTFDQRRRRARSHHRGDDFGNGDGLLAYPGPLPSLRLKALRRGLEDRLLLLRLRACGGGAEADALARRLVPRALGEAAPRGRPAWPAEEAPWEAARGEILDALTRRCPDAR